MRENFLNVQIKYVTKNFPDISVLGAHYTNFRD